MKTAMLLKEWMYDFPTNKKSANLLIDSFFYAWVVFGNKATISASAGHSA